MFVGGFDLKKNYKERYKRQNFVSLCFDDSEFKIVNDAIGSDTRASKMREIILAKCYQLSKIANKKNNENLAYELNKIGNNLNQLTKLLNTNIENIIEVGADEIINLFENIIVKFDEVKEEINNVTQNNWR